MVSDYKVSMNTMVPNSDTGMITMIPDSKASTRAMIPDCKACKGAIMWWCGGFILACMDLGRMFDHSFPACAFFFLSGDQLTHTNSTF